jgi:hypothetical protein
MGKERTRATGDIEAVEATLRVELAHEPVLPDAVDAKGHGVVHHVVLGGWNTRLEILLAAPCKDPDRPRKRRRRLQTHQFQWFPITESKA